MQDTTPVIRDATRADLPAIVALLANDPLGTSREGEGGELLPEYERAFEAIDMDPGHRLVVVEADESLVGTLQLSFLPNLTYKGGWRAQIEGVRVAETRRGLGIGETLIRWAIECAREQGCVLVQLTTDRRRERAERFYERLGFQASHVGMKLRFDDDSKQAHA